MLKSSPYPKGTHIRAKIIVKLQENQNIFIIHKSLISF